MGLGWLQCSQVELRCAQPAANDQKGAVASVDCGAPLSRKSWYGFAIIFRFQVGILWLPQVPVVGFGGALSAGEIQAFRLISLKTGYCFKTLHVACFLLDALYML